MFDLPILVNPCCPRCGKGAFGIKEFTVQGANFRHYAILCTSCGCVVGTETMQEDNRLDQVMTKLNQIENDIDIVRNALNRHGIY